MVSSVGVRRQIVLSTLFFLQTTAVSDNHETKPLNCLGDFAGRLDLSHPVFAIHKTFD